MQAYLRHSSASIPEVLSLIGSASGDKALATVNGMPVKVSSLRLRTFLKTGTKCHSCGLEATHFELNKDVCAPESQRWHLNLWGERNGEPELFTHDHKVARSLGGVDNLTNTETMCYNCNNSKGIEEQRLSRALKKN